MVLSEQHINYLRNYFSGRPIKKAYLFGSYSRDEADENSDIDILVELDHTEPIGMKFFSFQHELEQILNKKVDLVSYEGLSKHVKPFVDKDKVLIYER
jgi:predicted nucleotidyltransferase